MKSRRLSRRTLLRGAGALVALPVLEQMVASPARAQAAPGDSGPPRRLLAFYVPCGIYMERWKPRGRGAHWELSPTLEPLAPLRQEVLVLSGLSHEPGRPDVNGHHAAGTAAFLSCTKVRKTLGSDIRAGVSWDQVAARHLGRQTRLPSLELSLEEGRGVGNCDAGYACVYANNISWAGEATPVPRETRARAVFDRLFAGLDEEETREQQARSRLYKRSLLDRVREDAQALHRRLGTVDRHKLDEYLTSVRELEQRLEALEEPEPSCRRPEQRPPESLDVRVHGRAMMDLMVLAFQCDLTRVITFMLGNARSERVYDFLGLTSGHHIYSHHQRRPDYYEALARIDRWEVEQLAYLLQRLRAVQEPGGTLLDSSLVYFASEVADGNSHGHRDMPVVLAGRGGGVVTPGRHLVYEDEPPVANLFISLLASVGVEVERFGDDGTGPLPGLGG